MRSLRIAACAAFASSYVAAADEPAEHGVLTTADGPMGRYARLRAEMPPELQEELANPLTTIISMNFPRETVSTVGAAASYLLARTGYALYDGAGADHTRLMAFPLPENQRRLEYLTVEQALTALGGEAYAPVVDHVDRTIAFELRTDAQRPRMVAGTPHKVSVVTLDLEGD